MKFNQKFEWLDKLKNGSDKVLNFLNNLGNLEKLIKALRAGLTAFNDELKRDDTPST